MSGTNAFTMFELEDYDLLPFDERPKGTLLKFSVNPYNGKVVMSYQDTESGCDLAVEVMQTVIEKVEEIARYCSRDVSLRDFVRYADGDFHIERFRECPNCGCEPKYYQISEGGVSVGVLTCCDGMTRVPGFGSRFDAMSFWNAYVDSKVA